MCIRDRGKIFDMPKCDMPHMNESNYDEFVPESLREKFYSDYPLLKRIYDLAKDNYQNVTIPQRPPVQADRNTDTKSRSDEKVRSPQSLAS